MYLGHVPKPVIIEKEKVKNYQISQWLFDIVMSKLLRGMLRGYGLLLYVC